MSTVELEHTNGSKTYLNLSEIDNFLTYKFNGNEPNYYIAAKNKIHPVTEECWKHIHSLYEEKKEQEKTGKGQN